MLELNPLRSIFRRVPASGDPRPPIVIFVTSLAGVFMTRDLTLVALLLSSGFFFAELVIGPIWSVPMDIAPKYAGTASGLMNTGSAVAAIVSPIVFGVIVDATGSWTLPFVGSIGLCLLGAALAFTMHPEREFVDPVTPPVAPAATVPAGE